MGPGQIEGGRSPRTNESNIRRGQWNVEAADNKELDQRRPGAQQPEGASRVPRRTRGSAGARPYRAKRTATSRGHTPIRPNADTFPLPPILALAFLTTQPVKIDDHDDQAASDDPLPE
jgi:hypothetical protein